MTEPVASLASVLERSRDLGFLGPGPIERHVEQAEAFVLAATPPPARFLDLGSGGGLPGLVLALRWPDARGLLLDAQAKRVRFLLEAIEALELGERIDAVHARAEELAHDPGHRGGYDLVTARSFGLPAITAECAVGFVGVDGRVLVAEPPDERPERWSDEGLAAVGLADEGLVTSTNGTVRRLRSVAGPPEGLPRRSAAMTRRPKF